VRPDLLSFLITSSVVADWDFIDYLRATEQLDTEFPIGKRLVVPVCRVMERIVDVPFGKNLVLVASKEIGIEERGGIDDLKSNIHANLNF
jgi:hypothetical protein